MLTLDPLTFVAPSSPVIPLIETSLLPTTPDLFQDASNGLSLINSVDSASLSLSTTASWFVDMAGQLAPLASLGLCMAPMATMPQLRQQKSSDHNLPLLPYSSMVACTFVRTIYGILHDEATVWMSNGMGLGLSSYYCWEYAKSVDTQSTSTTNEEDDSSKEITLHRNVIGANVLLTTMILAVDGDGTFLSSSNTNTSPSIIGYLADALCLAFFASPLAKVAHVVETQSSESIPWAQSVATTINCGLWSTVGLWGLQDPYIAVPNTIGLVLGILQLSLKVAYGGAGGTNDANVLDETRSSTTTIRARSTENQTTSVDKRTSIRSSQRQQTRPSTLLLD